MAEAAPPPADQLGSGGEKDGDTMDTLQTGTVTCGGKGHTLSLTTTRLQLTTSSANSSTEGKLLDLPWRDVVCACPATSKKSKASGGGDGAASPPKSFAVHYIQRNRKNSKLKCQSLVLEPTDGIALNTWISQIEEKRKEGKPNKLLAIINPIGGKGAARQTFAKQVQPLFTLAGIETIVKETERAQHAVEIGKTFDISTVDGVVVVGGDGLYCEVLHSLILRTQLENRVDVNDPDANLVKPQIHVGIVPAGTGNGVSGWLNGDVIDVQTATLNIIRGETNPASIFSLHEPGKLISYCGLLVANGYFSQMIKRTDELRWMKRARYPYAMLSSLVGKKQVFNMEVEVLQKEAQSSQTEEGQGDASIAAAEAAAKTGWTKVEAMPATSAAAFAAKLESSEDDKMRMNIFADSFDLFMLGPAGALGNLKFLFGIFSRKKSALEADFIKGYWDIMGFRCRIVDDQKKTSDGAQNAESVPLERLLDVDGELYTSSVPQFEVRLQPQFLQVYSVNTRPQTKP